MIKIFENFYKKGLNITYSAIVLDKESKNLLLSTFIYNNPNFNDWIKLAHHMTICMGELPEHLKRYWLGEDVTLTVTDIGISDKVVAVKVSGFFNIYKANISEEDGIKFTHITLAVNPVNGKPVDSNRIDSWEKIKPLKIRGTVSEIRN